MTETERPLFSALVERPSGRSWRAAAPAVLLVLAAVVALAYLAARLSSAAQRASAAQQEAQAARQQLEAGQKHLSSLEADLAVARSPGRASVLLEGAAAPKGKKAAAPASKAWGVATVGEMADGKSWLRVMGYGFAAPAQGKEYHAFLQGPGGAPVDAGRLDPVEDGSVYSQQANLPAVDQNRKVLVSLTAEGAKAPEQVLLSAELPKLEARKAPVAAPAADAAQPAEKDAAAQKTTPAEAPAK